MAAERTTCTVRMDSVVSIIRLPGTFEDLRAAGGVKPALHYGTNPLSDPYPKSTTASDLPSLSDIVLDSERRDVGDCQDRTESPVHTPCVR
jgi:hypothetical protein